MLSKRTQNAYRRPLVVELPTSLWNRRGGFDFINRIVTIAKLPAFGEQAARKVSVSNAGLLGIREWSLFVDERQGQDSLEVDVVPIGMPRVFGVSKGFLRPRCQRGER